MRGKREGTMNISAWIKRIVLAFILVGVFAAPVLAGPYEDGVAAYRKGDFSTALRLYRPLAESGHIDAQFSLGGLYSEGKGVPQDQAEAMKWYRKSAVQGGTNAQTLLGAMYSEPTFPRWHSYRSQS